MLVRCVTGEYSFIKLGARSEGSRRRSAVARCVPSVVGESSVHRFPLARPSQFRRRTRFVVPLVFVALALTCTLRLCRSSFSFSLPLISLSLSLLVAPLIPPGYPPPPSPLPLAARVTYSLTCDFTFRRSLKQSGQSRFRIVSLFVSLTFPPSFFSLGSIQLKILHVTLGGNFQLGVYIKSLCLLLKFL